MIKNQTIKLYTISILLTLASCSPKVDNSGYVHEGPIKDQITVGQSTREDVRTTLGSPSSQSSFGEETWYYISARKEAYAFLRPEVVQQDAVSISFNDKGVVSKIGNYTIDNSQDFTIAKRSTPTEGHTLGFFEQVLGNVGRFNAPGNDTTAAGGRKPGN